MTELEPFRDLYFDPGEGYLYEIGGSVFLVYTGASKIGWAACRSSRSGEFTTTLLRGATRHDVLAELVKLHG